MPLHVCTMKLWYIQIHDGMHVYRCVPKWISEEPWSLLGIIHHDTTTETRHQRHQPSLNLLDCSDKSGDAPKHWANQQWPFGLKGKFIQSSVLSVVEEWPSIKTEQNEDEHKDDVNFIQSNWNLEPTHIPTVPCDMMSPCNCCWPTKEPTPRCPSGSAQVAIGDWESKLIPNKRTTSMQLAV